MTVTRIGETQADPETTETLRGFLLPLMPLIQSEKYQRGIGTFDEKARLLPVIFHQAARYS